MVGSAVVGSEVVGAAVVGVDVVGDAVVGYAVVGFVVVGLSVGYGVSLFVWLVSRCVNRLNPNDVSMSAINTSILSLSVTNNVCFIRVELMND